MSGPDVTVEALLRAHAPQAPDALRRRVLALEPQPRRRRRLVLVAVPAAAAAVSIAAVVMSTLGSPERPLSAQHGGAAAELRKAAPAAGDQSLRSSAAPATAGRLQHTDASIRIRVATTDDLTDATRRATAIAVSLGGFAQSVDYQTPQSGGGSSYLELRVPAPKVQTALTRISALGTLVSQDLSVNDLEQKVQKQSAQIAQLRRRVTALRAALKDTALAEAQRVILQIRLAETKRALAQRLHARKTTIGSGTTASISLVIGTQKSVVAPVERGRFGRIVDRAIGVLAVEALVLLFALIVISPFALLAAGAWAWRRRSLDRLLTT